MPPLRQKPPSSNGPTPKETTPYQRHRKVVVQRLRKMESSQRIRAKSQCEKRAEFVVPPVQAV